MKLAISSDSCLNPCKSKLFRFIANPEVDLGAYSEHWYYHIQSPGSIWRWYLECEPLNEYMKAVIEL